MLRLKGTVKLAGLTPQIVVGLLVVKDAVAETLAEKGQPRSVDLWITSANDSKHGAKSLHSRDGLCRALDFRTKNLPIDPARKRMLAVIVKEALGPEFDVVLEALGADNEHLHVEWDPKG